MIFTGGDYNRLYNYKITTFTVFVKDGGKGASGCGGGGRRVEVKFESSNGEHGAIKIE